MPASSSGAPTRCASSAPCAVRLRATSVPTTRSPAGRPYRLHAALAPGPSEPRSPVPPGAGMVRRAAPCLTHAPAPGRLVSRSGAGPSPCTRHAGAAVVSQPRAGVEREQVVLGLAADDDPRLAVAHRDDRRPRHVVVRCSPCSGSRRPCPGRRAGRRRPTSPGRNSSLHDDVAALAVLADDAGEHGRRVGRARRPACTSSRRRRGPCGCCRSCRRRRRRSGGGRRRRGATSLTVPTS